MRRRQGCRLAGLVGVVCGLSLVVGCTSDAVDPAGLDRPYGPQREDSAPGWPAIAGVELAGQSSRWWPVASARDLSPTGFDVVASSDGVGGMVVDGAGVVWVDMPWGLVRLDPVTWSASVWDVGDDVAFVSNLFVRASAASGVWLVEQDRARLFDGVRFVRDIQVPSAYLGEAWEGEEGIRDLVEVGSELWIASESGVARCDGHTWSMVGEGQLSGVESLQFTPWGEVWALTDGWGSARLLRYDGTGWTPIDPPDASEDVHTIAWDPTGGIVATSDREVMHYDGSAWQALLQLDEDDGEDVSVEAIAASADGTVWVIIGEAEQLLRSDDDGDWHLIASPDGTSPTGLAVSGDKVVVSADTGVYRVAGDEFELAWSPTERPAVVTNIVDVVSVSGDEAWIVVEDWSEEDSPALLHLQRVQIGRPGPILVASLPASAEDAYRGWPDSARGSAAVAASDGAIWYITDESVVRIADGTESVVASGLGEHLLGEQVLNVNVVAIDEGGAERADPRPREIGPNGFAELTVPGKAIEQTLYGDGDITCPAHWAHDLSLPIGQVQYTPTPRAIEITVTLDQAWPDTEYDVDVNTDQFCLDWGYAGPLDESHLGRLTTDRDGAGSLTLTYASRPPGMGLLAGDDGAVWLLPTARLPRGAADPEDGQRNEDADWEGLCLLTPDGERTPAELPAPARDIMTLVGGPGGNLWATVCGAGTQPGGWGDLTCPAGRQLMRWEAGWMPVAYPGADVTGLGASPDGGFWGILAEETGQFEEGILAHYREGSWTTVPEFGNAHDDYYDPDAYAVTPAGSVCRIDDERSALVCVDTSLRISRTPVGVAGNLAVAGDGAVWVEGGEWLARAPITVP